VVQREENLPNVYNAPHHPKIDPHSTLKYITPIALHHKGNLDYNYNYSVDNLTSGSKFGHGEKRSGDRVDGSYYVQLPDGRMQHVTYFADHTGYHSELMYQ
ncbi:unnamed protein product, partial [Meganyctiphanes norvegica]